MRTKTITYTRAKALTPSTLIEVQPSFSAQPENSHVRGDYSDTLLAIYAPSTDSLSFCGSVVVRSETAVLTLIRQRL